MQGMSTNRRHFLRSCGSAGFLLSAPPWLLAAAPTPPASPANRIDRRAVVRRHNPDFSQFDPFAALSVGNGNFAFTADLTGLQTFAAECDQQFPLCTASHWGWHTNPLPDGLHPDAFRYQDYDAHGRPVGYATNAKGQEALFNWLRQNPHRLHLGRLGFDFAVADGHRVTPADLKHCRQTLDLWTGILDSRFELAGQPVRVQTCCHPELDALAVRVESPLLATGALRVRLAFPYASPEVNMANWNLPDRHASTLTRPGANRARIQRKLDATEYAVEVAWSGASLAQSAPHTFLLTGTPGSPLELVCRFASASTPGASAPPRESAVSETLDGAWPSFAQTQAASAAHWEQFWTHGAALDLGACTDPRAAELERRVVLSQYQTALHCAGPLPSAETGLLFNSWYGKFHLEMHWWHSVHFTAWNRFALFARSLALYARILPLARDTARRQGYRGARWPKMIGPDGLDAPSPVGPLLIWQQPHPIYYAELCYRESPRKATLEQWSEIVFATADFMAAYAVRDPARGQFVLGPPLKTVSENTDPLTATNPTFELAYWRFGLRTAQTWRERLGLAREPHWDEVLRGLAPLPTADGLYLMQEGMADTYTKWNWEHPALLGALGVQPGDGVDPATMRRTVRKAMEVWQWPRTWGWDFPMAAMAAARSGEPELAVAALALAVPKNRYLPNGHNYQRESLTAYLPGNGGLLAAVALMAGGWTDGPQTLAPGFPANSQWSVRAEGFRTWM